MSASVASTIGAIFRNDSNISTWLPFSLMTVPLARSLSSSVALSPPCSLLRADGGDALILDGIGKVSASEEAVGAGRRRTSWELPKCEPT